MNAFSALGIVIGLIVGTLAGAFLGPVIAPYNKQTGSEIDSAKHMSVRMRGTIVKTEANYIYLKKDAELTEPPITLKVLYDEDTLLLVRKTQTDEQGLANEITLLTGPSESILRVGTSVYVVVWITAEGGPPHALMVFGTI